jgi:hypothetical protein
MKNKTKKRHKKTNLRKNTLFKKSDLNSNNGMLTSVWGPSMWFTLHIISFNYPVEPTLKQKKEYYNFFKNLGKILPCSYCRTNYKKNIKTVKLNMNVMKNRNTLSIWLYKLHNEINKMLGKKSDLTYCQVRQRYEMFRSRCLLKNEKEKLQTKNNELGCTKSFYGLKSKSVINIVPKTKRCKTIKIDKRCILK